MARLDPQRKYECLQRWLGNSLDGSFIIEPYSRIFTIWNIFIRFAFAYNLFYVPMSIGFDHESHGLLLILDVLCVLIHIIDIFILSNTALVNEYGDMEKDRNQVWSNYANNGLIIDSLAAMPIDYLAYAIGSPIWVRAWSRIFRLLKVIRIAKLLKFLSSNTKSSMMYYTLILYFIMFIYLNHFAACFMFYIGRIQYEEDPHARFDNRTWMSEFGNTPYHGYDHILDLPFIE